MRWEPLSPQHYIAVTVEQDLMGGGLPTTPPLPLKNTLVECPGGVVARSVGCLMGSSSPQVS
jgi:hypothetical protein